MSLNRILIEGRITKTPELKQTKSGVNYVNISVAVDDGKKDNRKTYFFSCTAWKETAERIVKYFQKGSPILIEGKLNQNTWTAADGSNRQTVSILISSASYPLGSYRPNQTENTAPQAQIQAQPTQPPQVQTPQAQTPQAQIQAQPQPQVSSPPMSAPVDEFEDEFALIEDDLPF